jgi:hypothetical protein
MEARTYWKRCCVLIYTISRTFTLCSSLRNPRGWWIETLKTQNTWSYLRSEMWDYQCGEWGRYKHLAGWFEFWARLEARLLLLTKPILTDPHSYAMGNITLSLRLKRIQIGVDHPHRSGASVKNEWSCTSVYLQWHFNGETLHYCRYYWGDFCCELLKCDLMEWYGYLGERATLGREG